jgi:hypothetical protein
MDVFLFSYTAANIYDKNYMKFMYFYNKSHIPRM